MEMAGAARGAVSSLLGNLSSVLVDEVKQLCGVRRALQSIKDEMESMNSFLLDLEEVHRPSHQQRTWMRQVRDLAYSAEHCISLQQALILREGPPAKGLLGYLPPVQTLHARHKLAMEVRELNERIKGVNERRQRYGVHVPRKSGDKLTTTLAPTTGAASSSQAAGGGDEGIIPSDDEQTPKDEAVRALAFAEPRILEECTQELVEWLLDTEEIDWWLNKDRIPSIAIAAPDKEDGADVALEALAHPSVATKFELKLWINFPRFWPSGPLDILREILGKLLPEPGEGECVDTGELDRKIEEIVKKTKEHLQAAGTKRFPRVVPLEPLDILRDILQELLPEHAQSVSKDQIKEKINETAMKIKKYLEKLDTRRSWIGLDDSEYVGILQELLPQPKEDKPVKEATDKLGDDQIAKNIEEITNKIKVDILRELLPKPQEDKSVKEDMDRSGKDHIEEKIKETTEKIIVNMLREMLRKPKEDMDKLDEDQKIEDITEKINRILENIKEHLLVKEITKKIKEHIEGKRTIIVLDGIDYVERWEVIKWALSKLGCAAGSAVIVTAHYTRGASQYCNPTRNPIVHSLVGFYHDKAVRLTSPFVNEDNYSILHAILKNCEPHELCMKLFIRALYANPNRSNEELDKLRDTLDFGGQLETNARKTIKFSYSDLPRDYKTCFLYLAIFPQGHNIKRSTLVGHWIAEGLIAKKDWTHSVHRAERCFDELVDRGLVYPCDIGAAGKVKSCTVDVLVIDFIAKTARTENFMDIGLSHQWSQHSIYNALRREGIMVPSKSHPTSYICQKCIGELCTFCIKKKRQKNQLKPSGLPDVLAQTARSIELQMLKVLDFEGYQNLKHHQVLKHILKKMFLLRYLSLRNTDVTKLPKKIGKLQLLEILDIRQTKVHPSSTKHIVLPKLKRLLAGPSDQSASSTDTEKSFSTVKIPHRIKKMANLEVLSHVEASQHGAELKDIGKLWQLRKLGVFIHDKKAHLKNLVRVIGDLSESLQSLSISIKPLQASSHDTPSKIDISFENPPKHLESLSISGITISGQLLPLLAKSRDQLTKVTLHYTLLNQNDLKDLAELPKLHCVRLRHKSYIASKLTFKNDEFQNLKNLLVEGSNMTEINFEDEAAPELENIVLSFANIISIIFGDKAAPKLEKIVLSSTNITGITFKNGAAPNLEEIILSSTNTTNVTFENGATPNLKKIVLSSFTNVEFLSGIDYLPALNELELNGSRIASALLSLFTNANKLAKVTLRDTMLKQGDLQILAKQPNLRFLMLLDKSCDERQLTFNKEEFRNLKLLVVECFSITKMSFAEGAAPKLEKIVWSFTDIQSLSGIDNLPALKELEFKGDKIPDRVREAIAEHPNYPDLKHTQQKNQDKEEE